MRLSLIFILLSATRVFAADPAFTIASVWTEHRQTAGKQSLALMAPDKYTGSDWLLIFGTKNGRPSVRSFVTGVVAEHDGWTAKGRDDFYDLTYKVTKDKISIELTDRFGEKTHHRLLYTKADTAANREKASDAVTGLYASFAKLEKIKSPTTLGEFKSLLNLLVRKSDHIAAGDDSNYLPLPFYDLEIELHWTVTGPSRLLASVDLKIDQTDDALSKLLKVKKWRTEDRIPSAKEMDEDSVYSFFRKGDRAKEFKDKALLKGAEAFLKYEVVKASAFQCEGSAIYNAEITWVLQDGSTYTYVPYLECD